jgi:hypothetical protein
MTTSWKIKPSLLALVIIIALAATMAAIGTQSATADSSAVAPELEGTWLATVTLQEGPPPLPSPFAALVSYARGGVLIVTDSSGVPAAGNVYQGTWTKTGPHEFTFTFLGFQYDANGFTNYIRDHETIRLEPNGSAYNGVMNIDILDTAQNIIVTFTGTSHATRVNAQ